MNLFYVYSFVRKALQHLYSKQKIYKKVQEKQGKSE
jgi:hypothetical protein